MTAPGAPRIEREHDLSLEFGRQASWTALTVHCRMVDGVEHRSGAWSAVPADGETRHAGDCGPLRTEVTIRRTATGAELQLTAVARRRVEVAELTLAGEVVIGGAQPQWLLYNGYQSWDRSGCARVGRPQASDSPSNDSPSSHGPQTGGPITGSVGTRHPASRESWWTVGVTDDSGAGLAAVAAGASSAATTFNLEGTMLSATWRETVAPVDRDLFSGQEGAAWTGPVLRLGAGADVRQCLGSLSGSRRAADPPVGWLSWYHFGPFVGLEEVVSHSKLLADQPFRDFGYRLVQVDDGWQQAYGEWLPNTKFPGGLASLADELHRRGQQLGIWTAPFLVSASADLAHSAPAEWFVLEPSTGERLVDTRHRVFGPMYILDASRPEVQAHLTELFSEMHGAGVRYFKIDFLYAGGYGGSRALEEGLAAIRRGAGDAYVLACGAPLLPVAGLAQGCRIGPDTATPLIDFENGGPRPAIFADEIVDIGRNLASRYFLDGWFQLDADVALVGGNLTLEQGRQLVTLAALAGGPFLASDDLPNLPPERMALLTNPDVMQLVGRPPAVPDWEPNAEDLPPVHWRSDDVLALFNWTQRDREIRARAPGARGARDLWACQELPQFEDGSVVTVPANGVRLLKLDRGRL